MKTIYENAGFTSSLQNGVLRIEIPIENLVTAFENCPNNFDELTIKKGCELEFADFVAEHIVDECDQETGDTYMTDAADHVFELIFEGYEDPEFVVYPEEEDFDQ